ncbi:MAG TPA: type II secretion system F family protein [Candidatus Absconditabacterales bacterium]|nr:type II secretion system F family protein [Candidatus Absconditabacterales bacterium]
MIKKLFKTEESQYKKYTKHSIDESIARFLKSRDKSSFGSKDKIFFFKELAYMLKGGVGLVQAVETIRESTDNYAVKDIAIGVKKYLETGKSLSYALTRLPDYFDEGDYSVVRAGEKSGNLPLVLESLATEYEYMKEIKNKYIGALIYPVMLIIIAIVSVIALFGFVLPSVFDIADSFQGIELPVMTRFLKNASDFFVANRKYVIYSIGGFVLVLWLFFSTDVGKRTRFSILFSIPVVGRMTKYYYLVRRCRYMKLMLVSGMNYVETFKTLRDILNIPPYQGMIERVLAGLQRGEKIYDSLKYETNLIPGNVSVLIKVGEETANLENSVDNVLKMYQEELNMTINSLSKVIEPIMLVLIGIVVVVIASGVFGLILQIMEGAGM